MRGALRISACKTLLFGKPLPAKWTKVISHRSVDTLEKGECLYRESSIFKGVNYHHGRGRRASGERYPHRQRLGPAAATQALRFKRNTQHREGLCSDAGLPSVGKFGVTFFQACGRVPLSHTRANVVDAKLWSPFIQFNFVHFLANLHLGVMRQLVAFYNPRLHVHVRHISSPRACLSSTWIFFPAVTDLLGYEDKPLVFRIGSLHPRGHSLFFSTLWSRVVKHKQALSVARCFSLTRARELVLMAFLCGRG